MGSALVNLGFAAVIFAVGLTGGLAALRRGSPDHGSGIMIARGNAFAAGIFISVGLLHMLPDASHHASEAWPGAEFPFVGLMAGLAIIFILALDQLGDVIRERGAGSATAAGSRTSHPLLLFVVLSVHSVIAGAALGLELDGADAVIIFLAIIAHKGAAGFALGTSMLGGKGTPASNRGRIVAFALCTPAGVLLGSVVAGTMAGGTATAAEAVFDALAAGTFLYVATIDMYSAAFNVGGDRLGKMIALIAGFTVMALVALFV